MLRAVLSVIAGYAVMFVLIFVSFTVLYLAIGPDRAFNAGTYDVSPLWIVASLALGTIAAIAGGAVCRLIARSPRPPKALVIVVVVLGLLNAILIALDSKEDPGPRTGDVANLEAMKNAKPPLWFALVNPVIGAAGVMIGATLVGKKRGAGEQVSR